MANRQPSCDIRTGFPLIPEENLVGMLAGLLPDAPITSLLSSTDGLAFFEAVADWMLGQPSTCLGTTLPGLWLARDQEIQRTVLPVRISAALSRLSITVWGDVLEMTPPLLLDIQGFGEGSLHFFLTAAAQTSAEACALQAPPRTAPTVNLFERRRFSPHWDFRFAQIKRLAEWAAAEAGAITVNDFLEACSRPDLPEDIDLLRDEVRAIPLTDLFQGIGRPEKFEVLVEDLCGVLDMRSQTIFLARMSLNHQRTLEDLATEADVTRERVRQISILADERIRRALRKSRFAPILWRAHSLRTVLGSAVPGDSRHLSETTRKFTENLSEKSSERIFELLLWVAGPYWWNSDKDWLQTAEVPRRNVVDAFVDERGRVDMERLTQHLAESGLVPEVRAIWLTQIGKVRQFEGIYLTWNGTASDKAARILEIWGKPATAEEIVSAIDEQLNVRGSRWRFIEDERFIRVDKTRFGLRSWGMEEYSSIAEQIELELERRDGNAVPYRDLVATLVGRFNLRESSVRAYVNVPRFFQENGMVRLRTNADGYDPVPPVTSTVGCYLLGPHILSWRTAIVPEMLRGSSRPLPAPIAAWLDLRPGDRCVLTTEGAPVGIYWSEVSASGPSFGSIRLLLEKIGGQVGDQILFQFRRDVGTLALTRIDPAEVKIAQGLERLSLLTGIPITDAKSDFLYRLGAALGTQGTRAAVRAALQDRGESAFVSLVGALKDSS